MGRSRKALEEKGWRSVSQVWKSWRCDPSGPVVAASRHVAHSDGYLCTGCMDGHRRSRRTFNAMGAKNGNLLC